MVSKIEPLHLHFLLRSCLISPIKWIAFREKSSEKLKFSVRLFLIFCLPFSFFGVRFSKKFENLSRANLKTPSTVPPDLDHFFTGGVLWVLMIQLPAVTFFWFRKFRFLFLWVLCKFFFIGWQNSRAAAGFCSEEGSSSGSVAVPSLFDFSTVPSLFDLSAYVRGLRFVRFFCAFFALFFSPCVLGLSAASSPLGVGLNNLFTVSAGYMSSAAVEVQPPPFWGYSPPCQHSPPIMPAMVSSVRSVSFYALRLSAKVVSSFASLCGSECVLCCRAGSVGSGSGWWYGLGVVL